MRKPVVLITGAGGEIGHALVTRLAATESAIITLDVNPLDRTLAPLVKREFTGSITDTSLLDRILAEFEVDCVFHLAALLSTRAEFTPVAAHHVNVEGTLNLLEFAQKQGESHGRAVCFLYPSSIATYGLPNRESKAGAGRVREDQDVHPTTMYGCTKQVPRGARAVLQALLQAALGERDASRRFPECPLSGFDVRDHDALGRDVGLRIGDDSCRRPGRAVRMLRQARHHDSVHGDAGRI